jgi:hypothetical protein
MLARLAAVTAIVLAPFVASAAPTDSDVRIDPRADASLRRMSNYLTSLESFRFHSTSVTDLVTKDGQKVQSVAEQQVAIKRPNFLRSDRQDPVVDATVRYDGRTISIYGKRSGYYAIAPMPPRMSDAVDVLRDRYGIDAPAADLFVEDPYGELMQDVVVGHYIGVEPIGGVPCEHLAFQGKDTDWQIWIEQGSRPLPRRYTIVSKHERTQPEFSVMLSDWVPNARIADSEFVFVPPRGSTRIQLQASAQAHGAGGGGER